MKSLTDFIATLPGVRPRKARALVLDGEVLSKAERADIRHGEGFWDVTLEVGPDAAAAILAAYRAGRLPMRPRAVPVEAPEAEAYLARRETLLATLAERERRRQAPKDLSLVRETDFQDDHFLDRVFFEAHGKGGGTLGLAGIPVTKAVVGHPTNSGKNVGYSVSFHWVGSDGVRRSSGRVAAEASNRRNDAERDWGLPGG